MNDIVLALRKAGYVPYYYLMHGLTKYTGFRLAGTPIWEHDWEVLVILDACRADVFAEMYGSDPRFDVDTTTSAGSASPEWLFNNFCETYAEQLAETAYVTGNPYSAKCVRADDVAHLEEVWRYRWDDEEGTVLPGPLSDEAIRVWKEVDPERMVVHYMQPHKPYVTAPDSTGMTHDDFTFNLFRVFASRALGTYPDFKKAEARRGEISDDELRELYRENLEFVVEALEETLFAAIDADVVVSADHGELLGEDGIYHHPAYMRYSELRAVPWAEVNVTPDGDYEPGERESREEESAVEEKLADLGYK